jgi:hypothetical protein
LESPLLQVASLVFCLALLVLHASERMGLALRRSRHPARTTRVTASGVGVVAGLVGAMHGYGELRHVSEPLRGFLF